MALRTLHEDNAVPLSDDDLRVESSRHGALYDSFSESEAGSRENSGATGQEYFKRAASVKSDDVPIKAAPAAGRRWFGLRKAASAGDLAVKGVGGDASRGSSSRSGMRRADSAHDSADASRTSQRSADGRAVRLGKGDRRSPSAMQAPNTAMAAGEGSGRLRAGSLRRLKYSARVGAGRVSALENASASERGSERDASASHSAKAAPAPRGADYYRAQAAAWREAAALEAAGRPVPRALVTTAGVLLCTMRNLPSSGLPRLQSHRITLHQHTAV